MHKSINDILKRITDLQDDLEKVFEEQRARFQYHIDKRRVRFEAQALAKQREFKKGLLRYWRDSQLKTFLAAPVIYILVVPLLLLDVGLWLYQTICFPAFDMKKVKRADFIVIDRHQLAYLNGVEKVNCLYCGYANGLLSYAREIASRTEERWCPIKHARKIKDAHTRYPHFTDYGDAEGYRKHKGDD